MLHLLLDSAGTNRPSNIRFGQCVRSVAAHGIRLVPDYTTAVDEAIQKRSPKRCGSTGLRGRIRFATRPGRGGPQCGVKQ